MKGIMRQQEQKEELRRSWGHGFVHKYRLIVKKVTSESKAGQVQGGGGVISIAD